MEKLKTYSRVNKRFNARGTIDYRVILFVLIYVCIIYQILDIFNVSIIYIMYILILSLIPIFGIYFTVSKEDNIVEILINIFKYLIKRKIYVYKYNNKNVDIKKYRGKSKIYSCKNK